MADARSPDKRFDRESAPPGAPISMRREIGGWQCLEWNGLAEKEA